MNKRTFPFLLCFFALNIIAVAPATGQGFLITGKCSIAKSGKVFLAYKDQKGGYINDSTKIKNGIFKLKGQVAEPVQAIVSCEIKPFQNRETNAEAIYIEPRNLVLQIQTNRQHKIVYKVTGSQTQKTYEWLMAKKAALINDSKMSLNLSTLEKKFVETHNSSIISAMTIALNFQSWSLDTINKLHKSLTPFVQQSEYGRLTGKFIKDELENSPGMPAKHFTSENANGDFLSLEQFKGRYILLDFWASWCIPCRAGFLHLRQQFKFYHAKGLEIIGISEDADEGEWRKAIESDSISLWHNIRSGFSIEKYGTLSDTARISGKYGIHYFPSKILIDTNGMIIARWAGESKENTSELDAMLLRLFK